MNQAFIDGQNLTKGTVNAKKSWKIDLKKFRVFLREKYDVDKAFYFIGVYDDKLENLYKFLDKSGYTVVFREHAKTSLGKKKGNVDTDIVFSVMDTIYRKRIKAKIVLVTGDGDYKKMVSRLITDRKFRVIMFPNRHWSSLYRRIARDYALKLYLPEIRRKIEYKPYK
jgi:uncharacterized LabA/DUF88 family protein